MLMRNPWRWPLTFLAALCAGPKILLMMPPWIAGCMLYRYGRNVRMSQNAATTLFVASIFAYSLYFLFDFNVLMRGRLHAAAPEFMSNLQWSNRFAGDYFLTIIIVANFIALPCMDNVVTRTMQRYQQHIRRAAGYTLSIYLFHMPLILIFGSILNSMAPGRTTGLAVLAMIVPVIALLAKGTEHKLPTLRAFLRRSIPMLARSA
jgi:peptidoglycan/LPS O-acetylase OafA/YrhL